MLFCKIAGAKVQNIYELHLIIYELFLIFAANFNDSMKKYTPFVGLLLIVAGTLLLLVGYVLHQTTNLLLTIGLVMIIIGVVGYIQGIKHANNY